MFPSHHLPHIHMKLFFLISTAFANVFFNRESNCSQLEVSIQQCILNKPPKFHNPQISILSPFLHPLLPPCILLNPHDCYQVKLFNVHPVSPEQHRATEQAKIQPKGRGAHNTPYLPLSLLWCWTRASQSSSLLVLARAVTRLPLISSSSDNLVWAPVLTQWQMGFPKLGAKKPMSATSQGTPKAKSFFLHINQDFAVLIHLPYLNCCNTGAACSLAMAC